MSKVVDDRITKMELDNQQFEQRAKVSLSTLDKLKNALDFSSSAKGLTALQNAGNTFTLAGISDAVESVSERFTTLGIIGMRALENITDKAINAGIQLAKSLSIDQLTSGFNKVEEKAQSVQTIVNATGKSVEEVEGYLEGLMWFSDETSYGFTDMTKSLAQLTSSGADIEKVLPMITGIANSVAYAGKGAGEFSRAIYNLNQSYGHGSLQYIDWKSLELAGVASAQLKEIFIQVGEELGKINKGTVTLANFGSTLKDNWADTEVMEKAFGKFSEFSNAIRDAVESGKYETAIEAIQAMEKDYDELSVKAFKSAQAAKTFTEAINATKDAVSTQWEIAIESILGNYEHQVDFWSTITEHLWTIFAEGMTEKNDFLKQWVKEFPDGREAVIQSFFNVLEALENSINRVKTFFSGLIPEITTQRLTDITKKIEKFTETLKSGRNVIRDWIDNFSGLQVVGIGIRNALNAVSSVGKLGISAVKSGIQNLIPDISAETLSKLAGSFAKYGISVQDIYRNTGELTATGQKFKDAFSGITAVTDLAKQAFTAFLDAIKPISGPLKDIGTLALDAASAAGNFLTKLSENAKETEFFANTFEKVKDIFKVIGEEFEKYTGIDLHIPTWEELSNIFGKIQEKVGLAKDRLNELLGIFGYELRMPTIEDFRGFIDSIFEIIPNIRSKFLELEDALGVDIRFPTWEEFLGIIKQVKSTTEKIGLGLANAKKSFEDFTGIDIRLPSWEDFLFIVEKIKNVIPGITELFKNFGKSISNFFKNTFSFDFSKSFSLTSFFDDIGAAWEKAEPLLSSIFGAIKIIFDKLGEFISNGSLQKIMDTLLTGGFIDLILTIKKSFKGLPGIIETIGNKLNDFGKKADKSSSTTIVALAGALVALSFVDGSKVAENMGIIITTMAAITVVMRALSKTLDTHNDKSMEVLSKTFKQMSTALIEIAIAFKIMEGIDADSALTSVLAIGTTLGIVALIVSKFSSEEGKYSNISKTFKQFSNAVLFISAALKLLSTMDFGEALIAVSSLAATLYVMQKALKDFKADAKQVASFAILGIAIDLVAPAIRLLATMDFGEALIAVGSLAAILYIMQKAMNDISGSASDASAFLVMALAVDLIAPAIRILSTMDFSGALIGAIAFAAITSIMVTAMNEIGVRGKKSAEAFIKMSEGVVILSIGFKVLSSIPIEEMIPAFLGFAAALATFGYLSVVLKPFAPTMESISKAIALLGVGLLGISVAVGIFVADLALLGTSASVTAAGIVTAIGIIVTALPPILESISGLLADFLTLTIKRLFERLSTVLKSISEFGLAVLEVIKVLAYPLADTVLYLVVTILEVLDKYVPDIIDSLISILEKIIDGVADALPELLETAVKGVLRGVINSILAIIDGILGWIPGVHDAMETAQNTISEVFSSPVAEKQGKEYSHKFGDSLSEGLLSKKDDVKKSASSLTDVFGEIFGGLGDAGTKFGSDGATGIIDGFSSKNNDFGNATMDFSKIGLDGLEGLNFDSMFNLGEAAADGFVNGIEKSDFKVENAMNRMANTALNSMKSILQVASPSKATAKIADFTIEGFINEIRRRLVDVDTSGRSIGERALEAIRSPISLLAEAIDAGIDLSPRIRPVLDLSGIQNGGSRIQSVLGSMDYSLRAMTSINRNQQVVSDSIISKPAQPSVTTINNYYDNTIDAKNVKEFNDIVKLSQNARRIRRMGGKIV